MFEKIGLPPKPSLRGNNWVVDASHCQGCSSQFSFINRKHHCRRCGGIFCGSCTQHRMILRGQGDSPVRICDPCKTLEEAARFESRNRHKSKVSKGGSGLASQKEDDILLNEKHASLSKLAGGSSSSVSLGRVIEADGSNHSSSSNQASSEVEVETPETLREKALEEKKKYRMLKDEGKSEEALRAFKRGKELERQAAALDISLRKNRRKALSSGAVDDTQDIKDHFRAASEKVASSVSKKNKDKEDFSAELRELGWSDLDLHEGEKKPTTLTVEGDLSSLVREVSAKPVPVVSADRSLVLGHKKKALELKRAGNLSEAKEELKKAKILERKIEEEELLGSTDESDDELSSLIRSMDAEPDKFNIGINIDNIPSFAGDFDVDGNLEVTEEDMEDPDMASALESLGWVEESVDIQVKVSSVQKRADGKKHETGICTGGSYAAQKHAPRGKLTIQRELIAVKKKALALRREDRLDESEQELQKAKVLEAELEESSKASTYGGTSSVTEINIGDEDEVEDDANQVTDQDLQDPTYFSLLKNMGWEDEHTNKPAPALPSQQANENAVMSTGYTADYAADYLTPGKSKKEIQRDLLALKRKALTLRRQGEMDAADEVLEIAKSLEVQLQELEKQTTKQVPSKNVEHLDKVTVLKPEQIAPDKEISHFQEPKLPSQPVNSPPNKNNISQEILSHKRKAVALKREGKLSEAKEELRLAKLLERQVDEAMSQDSNADSSTSSVPSKEKGSPNLSSNRETSTNAGSNTSDATSKEKGSPNPPSSRERFKLQQESLAHKRQALKLRREGKITEAEAELELAMSLESRLQELDVANSDSSKGADEVEDFLDPQLLSALQSIGFEDLGNVSRSKETHQSKDTTKSGGAAAKADSEAEHLAERIKSEKLMAVNLKRAGKQTEALAALRRAKAYEKKLHSLDAS